MYKCRDCGAISATCHELCEGEFIVDSYGNMIDYEDSEVISDLCEVCNSVNITTVMDK